MQAFCAGGDIKACALSVKKGEFEGPLEYGHAPIAMPQRLLACPCIAPSWFCWRLACSFFRTEYSLIYQLAVLKKPVVAMLDGITMGGGAGLSMHGAFRIATEKCVGPF